MLPAVDSWSSSKSRGALRCPKSSQALLERDLDLAQEAMPLIDVENEDAVARTRAALRRVRRAQIEITVYLGVGADCKTGEKQREGEQE